MDLMNLISKMITFIVLMLVGYIGARRKLLDNTFARALSKLVMDLFLTCTIINSVISERPALSSDQLLHVMAILSLTMVIIYGGAAVFTKLLRIKGENAPVFELLVSVTNNMFIGLPIVQGLYGATAVLYCALSCIPFNILLYSYGVWRLKSGRQLADKEGMRVRDVLTIPLIATLAALVIFIFDIKLPMVLTDLITSTSAATMPVSMIVIGATLGGIPLTEAFREKQVYLICALRLVVLPILTWLILGALTQDTLLLKTCVILSACPSAVVVTVLTLQYDYDASFASKGILVTTVLSMLTLPIWALILG